MPELPEVENMVLALAPCQGSIINGVYSSYKKLRKEIQPNLADLLIHSTLTTIVRKAKYLIFNLSNQQSIIAHAGMSGKFLLTPYTEEVGKHDHVILYLNNQQIIRYNDPRRFGMFWVTPTSTLEDIFFKNLGIDALSNEFNSSYLQAKLINITTNIKNTLLQQNIVAGIGNIYAAEALFYSKINPTRPANSLSVFELESLIFYLKDILEKSIKLGGSTLKDYKKPDGTTGNFQSHFAVYGKEHLSCITMGCLSNILKIMQNGRSTFFCPNCQKLL